MPVKAPEQQRNTAQPQVLYGTVGLAYGETELSFNTCAPGSACASAATSGMNIGWAASAGLEWMFAISWTMKAEYLYVRKTAKTFGVEVPTSLLFRRDQVIE
jgi:opacity protein-like surface antigen